jgi:hypothetical protein
MATTPLFTAIMTQFNSKIGGVANPFNVAVNGVLYPGEAPPEASFPYAVFLLVSDQAEWTFTDYQENCQIQFSIFGDAGDSVMAAGDALMALYDWCALTIPGYRSLYMRRSGSQLLRTSLTPNVDVWHFIIEYDVLMEKN